MVDTITEAVTKLLDGVTNGPWEYIIGHSDWGLPRSNAVVPLGVYEFDFDDMIAEVHSVTPYCAGSSRKEREKSARADANTRFIAAARDLVPALLADRDALKDEVERLKVQSVTVQDAAMVERVAYAMWKAEADRAAPNVGRNRTPEMFENELDVTRAKWIGLADAALRAIAEGRE